MKVANCVCRPLHVEDFYLAWLRYVLVERSNVRVPNCRKIVMVVAVAVRVAAWRSA